MPLEKGKSKKAFEHNVRTETKAKEAQGMKAGDAVKQALAIAYSMKRKAKK